MDSELNDGNEFISNLWLQTERMYVGREFPLNDASTSSSSSSSHLEVLLYTTLSIGNWNWRNLISLEPKGRETTTSIHNQFWLKLSWPSSSSTSLLSKFIHGNAEIDYFKGGGNVFQFSHLIYFTISPKKVTPPPLTLSYSLAQLNHTPLTSL